MNEYIRAASVLVIDEDGEQLGEMDTAKAIALAKEKELDLLLVADKANPPVTKIIDYGKYQYEQQKAANKQRLAGKAKETKGIRIGLRTGEGDLAIRVKQATGFLEKGHKVKVTLRFRGREVVHADLGFGKIRDFAARFEEIAKIEQEPKKQGHQIHLTLSPKPISKKSPKPAENEAQK